MDNVTDITKLLEGIIVLNDQTNDLYNMEYIYPTEDKCSFFGIYCVNSCKKIVYPAWLGYKFGSDFFCFLVYVMIKRKE